MFWFVLLTLHSWVRWVVVGSTLALGARCVRGAISRRAFDGTDASFGRVWVGAIDLQVSLGLLVYFTGSPLGFFRILHPLAMLSAAAVAHACWVWTRRLDDTDSDRFRRLGLGVLVTTAVFAIAIPWPFMSYGRPLARMFFG